MLELLKQRRSIRKYKNKPIEKEKLDIIVKSALTSPTGHNKRAWNLIIVQDKDILDKLSKSRGLHSKFIKDAAAGFIICIDPNRAVTWREDMTIMGIIIQLSGQSLGLGSCWIETIDSIADDGSNMESNVKKILNIPDNYRVLSMISMGYPEEEKKSHNEDKFKYDSVFTNSFGNIR